MVAKYDNPILVGHSFGGYLPLFCKELEHTLKGLVLLNSTPTFESALFEKAIKEHNLPTLDSVKQAFIECPSLETLKALYVAEAPYLFAKERQNEGVSQIINKLEYCVETEHWWYAGGYKLFSQIQWVSQKVPTLIIEAEDDLITPCGLFTEGKRFDCSNIQIQQILKAQYPKATFVEIRSRYDLYQLVL